MEKPIGHSIGQMRPSTQLVSHSSMFYASIFFARIGDQILLFAVPLVVFKVTGSAAWSGLAFAAETLPRILAYPICGALCDRFACDWLLTWSQRLRALACGLGSMALLVVDSLALLVLLSAVCGLLFAQGFMAREVMLPAVFPGQKLNGAISKAQAADQVATVAGPLLVGLMLGLLEWPWLMTLAFFCFCLADASLLTWRKSVKVTISPPLVTRQPDWLQAYRVGWNHVVQLPGLKQVILATAGVNLVLGVTTATSAAMFTGWHQQSVSDFSLLQAASAAITVGLLLIVARMSVPLWSLGFVACAGVLCGGLLTAIVPSAWGYAIGFLLVVGFDKIMNIFIRTHRARIIPSRDLGKTTGIIVFLNNLTHPAAGLLVMLVSSGADGRAAILVACALMALIVVWVGLSARHQLSDLSTNDT